MLRIFVSDLLVLRHPTRSILVFEGNITRKKIVVFVTKFHIEFDVQFIIGLLRTYDFRFRPSLFGNDYFKTIFKAL